MQTLRSRAFGKLAALSTKPVSSKSTSPNADLTKLCEAYKPPQTANGASEGDHVSQSTSSVPMGHRELEVLLGLCSAAPLIEDPYHASRLLSQIAPYVSESCCQAFAHSPHLKTVRASPWASLTYSLVEAVLKIGTRHASLRSGAAQAVAAYIENAADQSLALVRTPNNQKIIDARGTPSTTTASSLALAASLTGLLAAVAQNAGFVNHKEQLHIVSGLQRTLSEDYLLQLESTLTSIRTSDLRTGFVGEWKHYLRHYAGTGRPFGALALEKGFASLITAFACTVLATAAPLTNGQELQDLLAYLSAQHQLHVRPDLSLSKRLAAISRQHLAHVDEGPAYLQLETNWHQHLAMSIKSQSLAAYLFCTLAGDEVADVDLLLLTLERTLSDPTQAMDEEIATTALRCMAIVAATSPGKAANISRLLQDFLVGGVNVQPITAVAADSLSFVLQLLSQDVLITTMYSLGNSLSTSAGQENAGHFALFHDSPMQTNNSDHVVGNGVAEKDSLSLRRSPSGSTLNPSDAYSPIVSAIVRVARGSKDEKITGLAVSMLVQKVGKVSRTVDLKIIAEAATLIADGGISEFRSLLKLYQRLHQESVAKNDQLMLRAVANAQDHLSTTLKGGTELYEVYLRHLLETIVGLGEVPHIQGEKQKEHQGFDRGAQEIALLLRPLALLAANNVATEGIGDVEDFPSLQRDAWYNMVIHGFSTKSLLLKRHVHELKILAQYSRPLIDEELANRPESDIELNTVLRRGQHSERAKRYEKEIIELLPQAKSDIESLSYPELMFLSAAYLVETLRASTGDCTKVLEYFVDPKLRRNGFRHSALGSCMEAVASRAVDMFLSKTSPGSKPIYYTPEVAEQLSLIFEGCCHRVEQVQRVAYICADRIISHMPSVLCQRTSLFALLDLLTIMWGSCLESETDEYDWKSEHKAARNDTQVQLSDDYAFRRHTLRLFHMHAKSWVAKAINVAPLDVKGLLQTYLSDDESNEQFGHLSLGRSFAFDMGATIPSTDQRLGAIEREDDLHINTASDFMSQYTTRQEYRFTDPLHQEDEPSPKPHMNGSAFIGSALTTPRGSDMIVAALAHLETRLLKKQVVSSNQVRELLRRAASLLCRPSRDQASVAAHFVRIPFLLFSKQMMKSSLSLWMGVIKENPQMEPRILVEIIEGWITTVQAKLGIFNRRMTHVDPFFLKEEFAPSDKEANLRQQQRAHNQIAPHFRVLQFLSSHYAATRMNNSTIENAYLRFLKVTLQGLRETAGHPLAREVHFHVILLGFKFLYNCTSLDAVARWRLKDDILSAALSWFAHRPRWSFGGNRLQVKAETHVLSNVADLLNNLSSYGLHVPSPLQSLQTKQELLQMLMADEITRLMVWLFPLDHAKRHLFSSGLHQRASPEAVSNALHIAWSEDPKLALNLSPRFKSNVLDDEIRKYLLKYPEKALDDADALELLFQSTLPNDVVTQLKYLLYWAPVNPITAVTYFLPAFKYHPSIVQYAVRALESHSVDVTFFYVPQIVQTLRYDVLGYVERYIIETAKFSQLFAHQIIWNMKANSYKDEDSQIPDPVKPTLDKVMDALIGSFSSNDRDFYNREFNFFNEITGISGKLRPFIKKPKPEKKQKIEEELRKIEVDVGVYLPSNPDGVVVGIDRKSGKPLQSHAKAPFMATFRIRKEEEDDMENTEEQLSRVNSSTNHAHHRPSTFEVWQSAIFKVGDDCRQDVLALQMIATFRGIFHYVGLPVYVFPYRVTATAPGCGVIDVLPNSISRDMLGREAVNGLYEWFVASFGSEDSPTFQYARNNFVKSLAAYSVISYLLQFKDRHNGNIMFDNAGHILHIDFGFCFDIAPGGVRFERAPFKLTKEMVAVMGGSSETQSFRWFEEMCVKAFLASRPFVATLSHIVICMLDSGLPCFKPETVQHFKERFVLDKSEREAADFMRSLVHKSYQALSTKGYDQFQLLTNGIPY